MPPLPETQRVSSVPAARFPPATMPPRAPATRYVAVVPVKVTWTAHHRQIRYVLPAGQASFPQATIFAASRTATHPVTRVKASSVGQPDRTRDVWRVTWDTFRAGRGCRLTPRPAWPTATKTAPPAAALSPARSSPIRAAPTALRARVSAVRYPRTAVRSLRSTTAPRATA